MQQIHRWSIGLLLAGLMSAIALLMPLHALAADDVTGDAVPQELREAIRDMVEGQGRDYAGLCRETEQWNHHGETCAFVFPIEDGRLLVTYGVVATDEIQQRFFVYENGAWEAVPEMSDPDPEPADPTGPVDPNDVPKDLQEAIREFLQQRGLTYAGLCQVIDQGSHIGDTCAFVLSIEDGEARVSYGLVASDEINEEIFFQDETGWHATSSGPIVPPTEEPGQPVPTPRTPDVGDDDDSGWWMPLAILGVGIVAAGGLSAGIARRRR